MKITPQSKWTKFLAHEISEISGLSLNLIRDWRRRGYLNSKNDNRWNKHDIREIACLLVMKELSEFGIGPKMSQDMAATAANTIIYFALKFESSTEFTGEEISEKLKTAIRESSAPIEYRVKNRLWEPRFLILSKTGKHQLHQSINDIFEDKMWLLDGHEISLIIDLPSLAVKLLAATEKPILEINIIREE